jgi:hypothetical protein
VIARCAWLFRTFFFHVAGMPCPHAVSLASRVLEFWYRAMRPKPETQCGDSLPVCFLLTQSQASMPNHACSTKVTRSLRAAIRAPYLKACKKRQRDVIVTRIALAAM